MALPTTHETQSPTTQEHVMPRIDERYRIYLLADQYVARVCRVELHHALMEIEGRQDSWGYPLRVWWPIGWFTSPGFVRRES